jgi:hypothetical protein
MGYLCAVLPGVAFLTAGVMKALDTRAFYRQIRDYEILPSQVAWQTAIALAALECFAGGSLLLAISSFAAPMTILLLGCFSGVTVWSAATGRAENCGCYGGVLSLTPRQSVLLNALYVALLGVSWRLGAPVPEYGRQWRIAAVILLSAGAGVTSFCSLYYGALIDVGFLKVGRNWRKKWSPPDAPDLTSGSWFVVFLSKDCPHCKAWIPFLNIIQVQPQSPGVVGLMSMTGEERKVFLAQHMIRFPIHTVARRLLSHFAEAYPTAALLDNGVIRSKWVGELPPEYRRQCRQFYDSISVKSRPADARAFSG